MAQAGAAAQAICLEYDPMSDYLEVVHEVTNVIMRSRLIASGIKRLDTLHKKPEDFIRRACQSIRKHTGLSVTR